MKWNSPDPAWTTSTANIPDSSRYQRRDIFCLTTPLNYIPLLTLILVLLLTILGAAIVILDPIITLIARTWRELRLSQGPYNGEGGDPYQIPIMPGEQDVSVRKATEETAEETLRSRR